MKKIKGFSAKRGGVSIFVVSITCVLIVIITASFVRLMIRDQQQASNQDLSQSAYDSAQAGVEDAKRFIQQFNTECGAGFDLSTSKCQNMNKALIDKSCNMLASAGIGSSTGETVVQTNSTRDSKLDQAYTCVKVQKDTSSFVGQIDMGNSHTIPLKAVADFNQVKLSWHSSEDMTTNSNSIDLDELNTPVDGGNYSLISKQEWERKTNRPAIIKAQFFGYTQDKRSTFTKLDNESFQNSGNGLSEQIYFPARGRSALESYNLPVSRRGDSASTRTNNISPVRCAQNLNAGGYACSVVVSMGHTVKANTNTAFLRLTPIYRATNFEVQLMNNGAVVNFNGVQPKIDSTGRANDQFRRIESRIEFVDPGFPVPDFSVQVDGDSNQPLCKDFWVSQKKNGGMDCKAN